MSRSVLCGERARSSPAPNWMGFTNTLTMTLSFSRRARSTRLMCPAWRAPMVGTSPIEQPSVCHPRAMSRMNAGVATAIGNELLDACAVFDLIASRLGLDPRSVGRIRVLGARERAVADFLYVPLRGACDVVGEVGVALHELRSLAGGDSQHVVEDEDLPVSSRPGTDADGRNAKGLRNTSREVGWHALEDDAERAGLLELLGVRQDARSVLVALALDLAAAHLVDELRREPQVSHHGDAHSGQALRDLDDAAAALELDCVHASLLDESAGAGDRLFD